MRSSVTYARVCIVFVVSIDRVSLHYLFEVIAFDQVTVSERGVTIVRSLVFPVRLFFSYLFSFKHVIGHPCALPTAGDVDH